VLDIIKEYLVRVGFDVDNQGFKDAQNQLGALEKMLMQFGKGISESEGFKALRKAFQQVSAEVGNALRVVGATVGKALNQAAMVAARAVTGILAVIGIKGIIVTAILGSIAVVMAALTAAITSASALFMAKMAEADLQVRKLAISLLTTVENARSLKAVMDVMGLRSLEDLKFVSLIPEQREQFMALRQLAAQLRPDADVAEGLKNIRRVNHEIEKLKLQLGYFFHTLAGTLGKVLEGPLRRVTRWMESFNKFITQNMKRFADDMAILLGIFVKFAEIGAQLVGILAKMTGASGLLDKIVRFLENIGNILLYWLNQTSGLLDRYDQHLDSQSPTQRRASAARTGLALANPTLFTAEAATRLHDAVASSPGGQSMAKAVKDITALDYLKWVAKKENLRITSSTGGRHNTGSKHYLGQAIDFDHRGVSPEKIQRLKEVYGLTVLDERTRPKGQKVWGGPHFHGQIEPEKAKEMYNRLQGPVKIDIHVHGASSPELTAQAVSRELETMFNTRNLQGSYA
jgi:hypothetical protein